jgi:hypothetical protein
VCFQCVEFEFEWTLQIQIQTLILLNPVWPTAHKPANTTTPLLPRTRPSTAHAQAPAQPGAISPFLLSPPAKPAQRTRPTRPTDHCWPSPPSPRRALLHLPPGRRMSGPRPSVFLFLLLPSRPETSTPPSSALLRPVLRSAPQRSRSQLAPPASPLALPRDKAP